MFSIYLRLSYLSQFQMLFSGYIVQHFDEESIGRGRTETVRSGRNVKLIFIIGLPYGRWYNLDTK
jgi:hypothetical protein